MFNFFKKKPLGTTVKFKLSGLHCTNCSLSIDSRIEEVSGVISSNTNYARQESVVVYDPSIVDPTQFAKIIKELGYQVLK